MTLVVKLDTDFVPSYILVYLCGWIYRDYRDHSVERVSWSIALRLQHTQIVKWKVTF